MFERGALERAEDEYELLDVARGDRVEHVLARQPARVVVLEERPEFAEACHMRFAQTLVFVEAKLWLLHSWSCHLFFVYAQFGVSLVSYFSGLCVCVCFIPVVCFLCSSSFCCLLRYSANEYIYMRRLLLARRLFIVLDKNECN